MASVSLFGISQIFTALGDSKRAQISLNLSTEIRNAIYQYGIMNLNKYSIIFIIFRSIQ